MVRLRSLQHPVNCGVIRAALACGPKHMVLSRKAPWLGGLDSNQDSQIQSLESYQLDDLPAVENRALKLQHGQYRWVKWVNLSEISDAAEFVLNELGTKMRVAFYHLLRSVSDLVLDDIL